MSGSSLRLDKLLWHLRFAATRAAARDMVLAGHIRVNGLRVMKPAHVANVGDVLTLPLSNRVLVVALLALPHRRGPAAEAQSCYRDLSSAAATDSQDATAP